MVANEVVAITGASGFLAQHLIAYLQKHACDVISEIRTIDRQPFKQFLDYNSEIPIRHYQFDICKETELTKALASCTTVFHCAAKNFEFLHTEQNPVDQYWHDNVDATEILLDVMTKNHIQRLVYVGDAFAVLPPGDNYGLSEYMHQTLPARFMLGCYGESKARAEFVVRRAAEKGEVSAIILRPTFIFGEGEPHLVSMAKKVCMTQGGIPNINGDDRGNHQFIYAGNMAAIMERCLRCLIDEPEKYNNEVIFCVDRTTCIPFKDFILPYMKAAGFKHCEAQSYLRSFISAAYTSLLSKFDPGTCRDHLTLNAHRFLNGWTVGFSNRKLRLLLDFVPPFDQQEAMKQSLSWYERNDCIPEQRQSITTANERPRMG